MILLPKVGFEPSTVRTTDSERVASLSEALSDRKIKLYLPVLVMSTVPAKDMLAAMGLEDPSASKADFSQMTGQPDLYIENKCHQAVKVDEEGTEAAVATAVTMSVRGGHLQLTAHHARDRPSFMITVRPRMCSLGQAVNP